MTYNIRFFILRLVCISASHFSMPKRVENQLIFPVTAEKFALGVSTDADEDELEFQAYRGKIESFLDDLQIPAEVEWVVKMLEDVLILAYWFAKSHTNMERTMAITTFVKCRSDKSLLQQSLKGKLTKYLASMTDMEFQSGFDTTLDMADTLLFNYTAFKESPLMKKLFKFSSYCVALQIYDKMGITIHHAHYSKIERELLSRKLGYGPDFVHCLLDTVVFLLKQGRQCAISGNLDSIYHSGSTYVKWLSEAKKVVAVADHIGNKAVCEFDFHTYLAKLDELMTSGKTIMRRAGISKNDKLEFELIANTLRALECQQRNILTKQAALEMRAQPLGLFIFGTPGVGKTSVMDILFKYYAVLHKSDPAEAMKDHYKFTKNAFSKYWDNFTSNMWCVIFDDVVSARPAVVMGVDESIKELICVINNIPYVPDQAELSKKGTTPFKGDLVLISSNTHDLALQVYMSKTFAPYRRMPYRIEPIVREEFRVPNGMNLDSVKAKAFVKSPGAYDDFWRFKICKAVAHASDPMQGYYAGDALGGEAPFFLENMSELLEWYKGITTAHIANQTTMLNAAKHATDVKICECGGKHPIDWCPMVVQGIRFNALTGEEFYVADRAPYVAATQCDEELADDLECYLDVIDENCKRDKELDSWTDVAMSWTIHFGLYLYMEYYVFRSASTWFMWLPSMRIYVHRWIMPHLVRPATQKRIMELLGERVNRRFKGWRFTSLVLGVIGGGAGIALVIKLISVSLSWLKKPETVEPVVSLESGRSRGSPMQVEKDEGESFWYHDVVQTTPFDLTRTQASMKPMSEDDLMKYVGDNCAHIEGRGVCENGREMCVGKAFALRGNVWITNYHTIAGFADVTLEFTCQEKNGGITTSFSETFAGAQFNRIDGTDIVWFVVKATRPRKDLTNLVSKATLGGVFEAIYVQRSQSGVVVRNKCRNVHLEQVRVGDAPNMDSNPTVWSGIPDVTTEAGDCGSIMIGLTPCGPTILGFHMVGNCNRVGAQVLNEIHVAQIRERSPRNVIPGKVVTQFAGFGARLVEPHKKATVRYLEKGNAQFLGSLEEFNTGGKSRVAKTILCDTLVATGEYSIKHGAPVMDHWQPWMLALKQMSTRDVQLNTEILDDCVDALTTDILMGLPDGALEELQVVDLGTALNGAPGIKYIDSVNRSTSAGYPFNKSKKYFLHSMEENEIWQDGVDIDGTIEVQVDECLQAYARGERFHPIFKGTLKDEALPFKKIETKKTRVFTGGPFAWGLVVRMHYLSFVRLMTKHRLVFEAAVGTNTHSREWEQLGGYLTKHGCHRMVAGDYAAFDKGMPASVMMAAFEVMVNIHRAARDAEGNRIFTDDDLLAMTCIATDTSYPTIDFHGDLIEFNGTNPSGHPLTVIVNCIANSLYMRYAYSVLAKGSGSKFDVSDFQEHVALLTYGDDNAMSVSEECTFFNHTAIQGVLAGVGIKYTMADKEAESEPFITIDDVSFLKRTWRFDTDLVAYVAPLEHDSINKMLTIGVVSKTNCAEATAADVISSALGEYFFYGKEEFHKRREALLAAASECGVLPYLTPAKTPTWEVLSARFERASKGVCLHASL